MGPNSSLGAGPIKISCFAGKEIEQLQDKPNVQGKELVEINLPASGEESRQSLLVSIYQVK